MQLIQGGSERLRQTDDVGRPAFSERPSFEPRAHEQRVGYFALEHLPTRSRQEPADMGLTHRDGSGEARIDRVLSRTTLTATSPASDRHR